MGVSPAFASTMTDRLAQAQAAQRHGQDELAVRMAQSAIVADPADPAAYIGLANIYARQGHDEFAHSYYDKALAIDPSNAAALKAVAALDKKSKSDTASATP
jgi:Flp pilus assembly protein TadD